jgi:hypothetical protein
MQLKRWILGALVALALLAGAGARPAHACGGGGGYFTGTDLLIGAGALGAAYGDVAFTVGDTVLAAQGRRPPAAYGVLETLVAAPQAALFGYWTYDMIRSGDGDTARLPLALTLWTAALTAHGIYTIARANPDRKIDEPPRHASVDWRVAPAMVSAGASRASPGAVIFGRF